MPKLRFNKHVLRSDQYRKCPEDDFPEVIEIRKKHELDIKRE
ncbi:MAG: hypothetical protein ACXACE_04770 [Candidatus Thorarchaeota archaeon]